MEQMDHKKHRSKVAGRKAERKSKKDQKGSEGQETARQRNPKAFAIQSVVKAAKKFHRWAQQTVTMLNGVTKFLLTSFWQGDHLSPGVTGAIEWTEISDKTCPPFFFNQHSEKMWLISFTFSKIVLLPY